MDKPFVGKDFEPYSIPRSWVILGLAVFAWLIVLTVASFAQDVVVPETVVTFQWGDLLAVFLTNLAANPDSAAWTLFGLVMAWVAARLPAPLQWAWRLFQIEQLLEKSLKAGFNSTAGAYEGRALSVNVGNEVIANALQYAIDNGSAAAIKWAGGPEALRQKLLARVTLEQQAKLPL